MTEALLDCPSRDERALLVRQPIFDGDKNIWGYELVPYGSLPSDGEDAVSLDDMVAAFLDSPAAFGLNGCACKLHFLTIDNEEHLEDGAQAAFLNNCVLGVRGRAGRSSAWSGLADRVLARGGRLAINADADAALLERLLDRCDYIKVSLAGKSPADVVGIRRKYRDFPGELVAMDIPDWESFEGTKALGFKYFHGPFFAVPRLSENAKLCASSVPKLQLLRELSVPSCEMDELASIIASDVSLSYRILRYINSPAFGTLNEIKSIQQAVSLLGLKELKHWATVVIMTDLDSTALGDELAYMALQRARFLSSLSLTIEKCRHTRETMFMLGLFSKLDALLSYPMEEALRDIPMEEEIKEGLCGVDNEYGACLRMLGAVERADWDEANKILGRYGVSVPRASIEYMRASKWAAEQLPSMKSS